MPPKPLYDITPFTTLDYPEHLAAIFWFARGNMRCTYCYNRDIVFGEGERSEDEAIAFLKSRTGMLEAVVLSGGEATLYGGLPAFCARIRAEGFKIKLDTNGLNPTMVHVGCQSPGGLHCPGLQSSQREVSGFDKGQALRPVFGDTELFDRQPIPF